MTIEIRALGAADLPLLQRVAPEVFDHEIDPARASEYQSEPRHHLAVAIHLGEVIGFASAVHYVHPDKPPELWINEVGVAPGHQGQGIGKRLLTVLFEVARGLGCREAWVLTDRDNAAARRLYTSAGGVPGDQVMFTFRLP